LQLCEIPKRLSFVPPQAGQSESISTITGENKSKKTSKDTKKTKTTTTKKGKAKTKNQTGG